MNDPTPPMTSNRPYLIRAVYEWIADNDMTPHLLVDAQYAGMRVPMQAVKDGRVVLNIAARAVNQLELGNEEIRFLARFGGVSQSVRVPLPAVLAIYALESGQGMALPDDSGMAESAARSPSDAMAPSASTPPSLSIAPSGIASATAKMPPALTSVAAAEVSSDNTDGDDPGGKRGGAGRSPHLRVVK